MTSCRCLSTSVTLTTSIRESLRTVEDGGDETTTETGRDLCLSGGPVPNHTRAVRPSRKTRASQGASASAERARSRQSELIWPERDCRNDPPHTSM